MTSCMTWLVPAAGPERERPTGTIGRPPYRPHPSLLYAELPEERKPAIIGGLGLDPPATIRIGAAEPWADFREPAVGWRRVTRVPLAGWVFPRRNGGVFCIAVGSAGG
jgi:hypothetical protein